jgi:hypothetical protein
MSGRHRSLPRSPTCWEVHRDDHHVGRVAHPPPERTHPHSQNDGRLPVAPMHAELRGRPPAVKTIQDDSGRPRMAGELSDRCLLYSHGLTQEACAAATRCRRSPSQTSTLTTPPPIAGQARGLPPPRRRTKDRGGSLLVPDQHRPTAPEAKDDDHTNSSTAEPAARSIPTMDVALTGTTASGARIDNSIASGLRERELGHATAAQREGMTAMRAGRQLWTRPPGPPGTSVWSPGWNSTSRPATAPGAAALLRRTGARTADADDEEPVDHAKHRLARIRGPRSARGRLQNRMEGRNALPGAGLVSRPPVREVELKLVAEVRPEEPDESNPSCSPIQQPQKRFQSETRTTRTPLSSQLRKCRPRACGAVPLPGTWIPRMRASSPRTRGCSVLAGLMRLNLAVVPAPAGLFSPLSSRRCASRCRPRACGAVPATSGRPRGW